MTDENVLVLLDVLDGLAEGYRECAQNIYAMQRALSDEGSESSMRVYAHYLRVKVKVAAGAKGLDLENEKWRQSVLRIETMLAGFRQELSENPGSE